MTEDWPDTTVSPPLPTRPRRVVHFGDLELEQAFWFLAAAQPEPDGMAHALSGVGTLWARQADEAVGLLQFQLLRAPWADGTGEVHAIRVFAVRVERPGNGIASAMYRELRGAHPGYVIGADEELTDMGRRMVKHFRAQYPDVHVGRFDTAHRLHRTSGSEDPLYEPNVLA